MSYPKNLILKNPAGTWSFVGRVDARLSYVKKDGSELDDATASRLVGASNPGMIAKVRVYPTKEAALEAAKALGVEVTDQNK